jgi:hypothetical protein
MSIFRKAIEDVQRKEDEDFLEYLKNITCQICGSVKPEKESHDETECNTRLSKDVVDS